MTVAFSLALFVGCGDSKPAGGGSGTSDGSAATGSSDSKPAASDGAGESVAEDVPKGEWGTLRGRFVYVGDPPEAEKLNIDKDLEVCGKHDLRNQSIVVGANGGLANVLIWCLDKDVETHPDFAADAAAEVELDNKDCHFVPHVVALHAGQTLLVKNSDPVVHNSDLPFRNNTPVNPSIPAGSMESISLQRAERMPIEAKCSIHRWMSGHVMVTDNPYFDVSAEDGSFEIANLPTGLKLEFRAWHEVPKNVTQVELKGKPTTWKTGKFETVIRPGDNDLGDIRVDGKLFTR
jgi:plastocyanin